MDSDIIMCKCCNELILPNNYIDIVCCGHCQNAYYFHEQCINNINSIPCEQCKSILYHFHDPNALESIIPQSIPQHNPLPIPQSIPQHNPLPIPQSIPQHNPLPIPENIPQCIKTAPSEPQLDTTSDKFCNICGDVESYESNPLITTSCNHLYHYDCLLDWFNNCNEKRECPYCRVKYKQIPQIDGKQYCHIFNLINRTIMKDLCLSENGCMNRGYSQLEGLCFYDYEKMIVEKYQNNRNTFIAHEKIVLNILFGKCSTLLKNGNICSCNTKYIYDNKPYCVKHYLALTSASNVENNEEEQISTDSVCSHNDLIKCGKKITMLSGQLRLCKKHLDMKLLRDYDDIHLNAFDAEYDNLHNAKIMESAKYCMGYKHSGRKCFVNIESYPVKNKKYCCYNHGVKKPKWLTYNNTCRGHHPITKKTCNHKVYEETLLCILHTAKLDQEVIYKKNE
jgi:hypothetical protein